MKNLSKDAADGKVKPEMINDKMFEKYLNTSEIPDPELLIRTSGEFRISNFLLWQIAYSELFFTEKLWPDFRKEDLFKAIGFLQKGKNSPCEAYWHVQHG